MVRVMLIVVILHSYAYAECEYNTVMRESRGDWVYVHSVLVLGECGTVWCKPVMTCLEIRCVNGVTVGVFEINGSIKVYTEEELMQSDWIVSRGLPGAPEPPRVGG